MVYIDVELTPAECVLAKALGDYRQAQSVAKGLKDSHGFGGDGASIHMEGVGGEMAFAKAFDLYPGFTEGTFKAPDFGRNIQVRTRSHLSYDLIVRTDDSPGSIYVLVTGKCPKYRILGWMLGADAMQDKYLADYGGREFAFFPPHEALRSVSDLKIPTRTAPVVVAEVLKDSHPF